MQAPRGEELLAKMHANPGMRFWYSCPLCDEAQALYVYSNDPARSFAFGNFCRCNQFRVAKALLPSFKLKRGSGPPPS